MCMYCDVNCNSSCDCCEAFRDAIERVRELHYPMPLQPEDCANCLHYYPCPTIKALDGEQ